MISTVNARIAGKEKPVIHVKTSVMQTRAATVGPAMMLEMLFDVPALLNGVAVHVILQRTAVVLQSLVRMVERVLEEVIPLHAFARKVGKEPPAHRIPMTAILTLATMAASVWTASIGFDVNVHQVLLDQTAESTLMNASHPLVHMVPLALMKYMGTGAPALPAEPAPDARKLLALESHAGMLVFNSPMEADGSRNAILVNVSLETSLVPRFCAVESLAFYRSVPDKRTTIALQVKNVRNTISSPVFHHLATNGVSAVPRSLLCPLTPNASRIRATWITAVCGSRSFLTKTKYHRAPLWKTSALN